MPFDINNFITEGLPLQGARSNLFELQLTNPIDGAGDRKLTLTAKAAQIPGSTIGSVIVPYFGRQYKVIGDRTYPEWTITVINDEDFIVRNAFERWMNAQGNHIDNIRDTLDYMVDIKVTQFAKSGDKIKTWNLIKAFPTDMAPIDVSWETNDTVEEYTVTFQFQWWETEDTTS